MTPAQRAALEAALQLPYPAFPCRAGAGPDDPKAKRPTCRNGFKDACTGTELRRLWRWSPGELIGVPTGEPTGFAVLDIDPRHDGHLWFLLNKARFPSTRWHRTRSGGCHFLF